ncbi:MAG: rRNA maturation RNase YbeY [Candidatus Babeliales bacterium]
MITIKNTQRSISLDLKKLKDDAQTILHALDYSDFDLGIWLTTNKTIHHYNKEYRHKDKPTDILSFPFYPELKAGERIHASAADEKNLGDLIISLEYVQKAAKELGVPFYKRMQVLLVHGICHLLGYDHIKDEDYKVMHKKELFLLKKLNTSLK